jgi:hypothetical protein
MANMMFSDLWLLFNFACFSITSYDAATTIMLTVLTAQASGKNKFKHFTAQHEKKDSP